MPFGHNAHDENPSSPTPYSPLPLIPRGGPEFPTPYFQISDWRLKVYPKNPFSNNLTSVFICVHLWFQISYPLFG